MLFKKEELDKIKYMNGLANHLNEVYRRVEKEGINNFIFYDDIINSSVVFDEIKNGIIYIDDLLVNFIPVEKVDLLVNEINIIDKNIYEMMMYDQIQGNLFQSFFSGLVSCFNYLFKKITGEVLNTRSRTDYSGDFLNLMEKLNQLDSKRKRIEQNNSLKDRVVVLEEKINNFINQNTQNMEIFDKKIEEFLLSRKLAYDDSISSIIAKFKNGIFEFQNEYENDLKVKVDNLKANYENNKNELDTLLGAFEKHKSLLSKKTENEISKHYSTKAKWEKITYWVATFISILIILVSIGLAWCGLDSYYQNYVSVSQCTELRDYKDCIEKLELIRNASKDYAFYYLIMRLIFSILLFLTVIYTSRIAIRAYSHWRHSENMHLKLASLRPFINSLKPDEQSQIHKDLVPDYFGKDAGIVDGQNEKFKDLPANVSAVAMKAIEQIGGGSSEGKDAKKGESN
ncbi:hypothetical protein ACINWC323_3233 [Acinetobacter sp. WC-323]|uniref:hypothetical protein n=1 Tax=Acinetobacter sp. WC-323 TaxID=903918 RepID=UPI00029DF44A|nr:hypothetical protein [Acinetobacter sp. WC-323]EKU54455.1 hypothetical protein ACINWC323_3233 [Acinetobacter sp. WC-323]